MPGGLERVLDATVGLMAVDNDDDGRWLNRAVELAAHNVTLGGGPFGSVVVKDGKGIAEAANGVVRSLDPTAHAEVLAIRAACQSLQAYDLSGCVLYASCEPCPMCLTAAMWARVDRVVFAADHTQAAAAGFDDKLFYDMLGRPREGWELPLVQQQPLPHDNAPFDAWNTNPGRAEY